MQELKQKIEELVDAMKGMLDRADAEKRDLTPAEVITYRGYEKECDEAQEKLDRLKGLKKREDRIDEDGDHPHRVSTRGSQVQSVSFAPIRRWREAFGHEPEIVQGFRNNGE